MKLNFNNNELKQGIYVSINKHSNRIYVGKTIINFKERWNEHVRLLLQNKHFNKFLQRDYNKCKKKLEHDDFLEFHIIEILESPTQEEISKMEQFYILSIFDNQEFCYNIKKGSEEKERSCFSNTPEKTKKIHSENSKKMWSNPEFKEKMRKSFIGRKASENAKKKMSTKKKERWKNKTEEERKNQIAGFIEYNEIKKGKIDENSRGMNNPRAKIYDNIKLMSPNGEIFTKIECLNVFCRKNGLDPSHMIKVLNKKLKTHKGWKLAE